jgi:hypothetical protein
MTTSIVSIATILHHHHHRHQYHSRQYHFLRMVSAESVLLGKLRDPWCTVLSARALTTYHAISSRPIVTLGTRDFKKSEQLLRNQNSVLFFRGRVRHAAGGQFALAKSLLYIE